MPKKVLFPSLIAARNIDFRSPAGAAEDPAGAAAVAACGAGAVDDIGFGGGAGRGGGGTDRGGAADRACVLWAGVVAPGGGLAGRGDDLRPDAEPPSIAAMTSVSGVN